jgi:glycosyltransferase involved in cell wall biosynthesis
MRVDAPEQPDGSLLLVANYAPDVGFAWWLMENFWVRLSLLGRNKGLAVLLAYPKPGPIPERIREAAIETVTLSVPGAGWLGVLNSLRFVRARRVKCVYLTDRRFTSVTYMLFRLLGVRLIINHDHTPGDRPPIRGLKGFLEAVWRRLPLLNCDLQICVSPLIAERAVHNARIPRSRVAVVQNGIPLLHPKSGDRYAHRQFGIPREGRLCVTVARASPYKRIDFVIEVARLCYHHHQLSDLYFVYCGDGPDMERLHTLAEEADVLRRFFFAGRRSDVAPLLCGSNFALHPSQGEAFSLAILEYMSAGLTVIVPDVPTVCQAITHGETGLIYPDGQAAVAADMLSRLMSDRSWAERMGTAAAQTVRDNYSFDAMNLMFDKVASNALLAVGQGDDRQRS